MINKKIILILFATLLACSFHINAECPNGCSGAGTCGPKDKCTCFKNRQGNDCSQHTCPFGYAHVDSPKGDLNMDGTVSFSDVIVGSQVYPTGTREKFPLNVQDEAHFYSECSSKGLCDRSSGDCECFDGYDGSSCQRASCPNDCSGHGTCESISELASDAGGTLFGEWVSLGAESYTLWDQFKTYGCKCDPWFYGPDCSTRRCKVGVDPMYLATGSALYDTQVIRLLKNNAAGQENGALSGSFRLRFYDYWGESWITEQINVGTTDQVAAVTGALTRLPNNVIGSVTCEKLSALTTLLYAGTVDGAANYAGFSVACSFTSNPGKLRLMQMLDPIIKNAGNVAVSGLSSITGTAVRGEDLDWAPTKAVVTGAIANNAVSVTATQSTSSFGTPSVASPKLVKINAHYLLFTTYENAGYTSPYHFPGVSATTGTDIFVSSATVTKNAATITTFTIGETELKTNAGCTVVRGNWLFIYNQLFLVLKIAQVAETGAGETTVPAHAFVTVDRPFNGKSNNAGSITEGEDALYVITPPSDGYGYVSECSGRGLCDSDSGICSCFKGYTKDNCNTQNILAF